MTLAQVLEQVDALPVEDQQEIYKHLQDRLQQRRVWLVPGEQVARALEVFAPVREEALSMTDEEIDEAIDDAIVAVRRERDIDAQNRR